MISATLCREVSRNVPIAGGTVAAISAIRSSLMTPGPLGMFETKPSADAPQAMARAASSTLPMQQTFTRGVRVARMRFPLCSLCDLCVLRGEKILYRGHRGLLAIGNPDVLHLGSVLKKPAALSQLGVEPVDSSSFVRPNLLQIANRHGLGRGGAGFIAKAPDGIDIVVFGERLQKLRRVPGHNIQRATGKIAGVEKLVEIARDKRIGFRRNGDHRVSNREGRHYDRKKTE